MHVSTEEGSGIVVTLTDAKNKSFREYDFWKRNFKRKSRVVMPWDTEYKIMIKNNNPERLLMDVEIDGTTVSGPNGLVVSAYGTDYLERFFNSDKKFKFVPADSEEVADPTSSQNGIIRVKLTKEQPFRFATTDVWYTNTTPINNEPAVWQPYNGVYGNRGGSRRRKSFRGGSSTPRGSCVKGQSSGDNGFLRGMTNTTSNMSFDCNVNYSSQVSCAGATVEGSASAQTFGTTQWRGSEGPTYEFVFKVTGEDGSKQAVRDEISELKKKLKNLESRL